jgi:hypothetical protein
MSFCLYKTDENWSRFNVPKLERFRLLAVSFLVDCCAFAPFLLSMLFSLFSSFFFNRYKATINLPATTTTWTTADDYDNTKQQQRRNRV